MLEQIVGGRYRVIETLGQGGIATTYIAQDLHQPSHPQCAVKCLKPANNYSNFLPNARRLFNEEAEILEKLGKHDQIPQLLAYFEDRERFYLIQEYIEGHTLHTELPSGHRWSQSKVIALLRDILPILAFVHSHRAIHRDIKPSNLIRRNSDRRIVLIDFGAVKQIRNQATIAPGYSTIAIGTEGYMPTEQVRGKPRYSSDLYALGMVCIQALTGIDPLILEEDEEGEVIWQDKAQVSEDLARILNKMVRYHFSDRYQSASEILQDLQIFQPEQVSEPVFNSDYSVDILPETRVISDPNGLPETRVISDASVLPETRVISDPVLPAETKVIGEANLPPETRVLSKGNSLPETKIISKSNSLPEAEVRKTPTVLRERYQILQTLSDTGFRQTYLAQNISQTDCPRCIIKRLQPVDRENPNWLTEERLFQREVETLNKLGEHDQIPKLLDSFKEEQAFYLVQEYVEGQPLSVELLPHQRWTEDRVSQLLEEVLKILEFVHTQGVIHRDIKPDNIIRRQTDNCLVLVDFGAVKEFQTASETDSEQITPTIPIGTPGYMPTEQGRGKPRPSSDIYALGIIGIQALTGLNPKQLPEDPTTGELLWQPMAQVSSKLAAILNKMVRYHFKDRYQSSTEVLQDLKAPVLASVLPQKQQQRGKVIIGVVLVAVAALGSWVFLKPLTDSNWQQLDSALKVQNWKEADELTYKLMLQIAGDKSSTQGRFSQQEWDDFDCDQLKKIDSLWSQASNSKLGFKAQKEVFESVKQNAPLFYTAIGWEHNNTNLVSWKYNPTKKQAEYSAGKEPSFNQTLEQMPKGYLPAKLEWNNGREDRFERIYSCGL